MSDGPIVYIVEDDPGMRKSLEMVMASAALRVKSYDSADAFLKHFVPGDRACLVLDLQMPGMHGLELLRELRAAGLGLPVIVVTGTGTIPAAVESMKLGVVDFVEKPVGHHTLLSKVLQAIARDATKRVEISEADEIRQRLAALTQRERELLGMIVGGSSSKEIAADLGISIKTVANHRAHLIAKAGAVNTADLVRMSMIAAMGTPEKSS
jgi:two-component system response regulator FixJ